jgi:hypothetical protein
VYEVYLERAAERDLRQLSVEDFHRVISHIKAPGLLGAARSLAQRAIDASGLETTGSSMRLTKRQRP